MEAHLHILEGPRRGERIPLRPSGSVVGREPGEDVDIVLPDAHVSSRHARFTFDAVRGTWIVEDLDSTNGTRVDERAVVGPVPVRAGTRVVFGGRCLAALEIADAATGTSSGHRASAFVESVMSSPSSGPDLAAFREAVDLLRTRTEDARAFVRQVQALADEVERASNTSPLEAQRLLRRLASPDGELGDLRAGLEELLEQFAQAVRWLDASLGDVRGADPR